MLLDRDLAGLCESLSLPRYQVELTDLRLAIVESSRRLGALMAITGATVRSVETAAEATFGGVLVRGTADLVLSEPDVVLDLKWSATTSKAHMKNGTALQLAAYAELFALGETRPSVGYFILRSQHLLAERGSTLPDATFPGEHTAQDIWRGALPALAARLEELSRGELFAPGATNLEIEGTLAAGHLSLAPGCKYCQLSALCGRSGCL
jgi:hypothetical protein